MLAVTAIVGIGLAWPVVPLVLLAVVGLGLTLACIFGGDASSSMSFEVCDAYECERERVKRLELLIAQRRACLASPSGPAPSMRQDALARQRVMKEQRR